MPWQPSSTTLIVLSISSFFVIAMLPSSRHPLSDHEHHGAHSEHSMGEMMMMPMSFEWTLDTILVS